MGVGVGESPRFEGGGALDVGHVKERFFRVRLHYCSIQADCRHHHARDATTHGPHCGLTLRSCTSRLPAEYGVRFKWLPRGEPNVLFGYRGMFASSQVSNGLRSLPPGHDFVAPHLRGAR